MNRLLRVQNFGMGYINTMKHAQLTLTPPKSFHFRTLLYSHGWSDLEPFKVSADDKELRMVISLSSRHHVLAKITEQKRNLSIHCESVRSLNASDRTAIKRTISSAFRLDDSLDEFYALCRKHKHLQWIPTIDGGRMLRSATVFEDIVKMICTTNCSWSLTKIMVNNLTTKLGAHLANGIYAFPFPETIASQSERWMRKETSSGYRAPYLLEFAERVASGALSVEHLRHAQMTTEELYHYLRTIKGVGHYAAGNLLKLLGHYDYLSIDSWIRSQFSELHRNGRKVSDTAIEKHYAHYGKWRGLVCWMEMTKEWHHSSF
jgi:3-methyladenine DNA glycosylase/8-oxoguanine DNA glycosylase